MESLLVEKRIYVKGGVVSMNYTLNTIEEVLQDMKVGKPSYYR